MTKDNLAKKNNKIINYSDFIEPYKDNDQFAIDIMKQIKKQAEKNAIDNADEFIHKKIKELEENVNRKQTKLRLCIPTGMIAGSIFSACLVASCVTMIICQIISNVTILEYHLIVFVLLGALGLLHTSLCTIKNWKRYIENDEKK